MDESLVARLVSVTASGLWRVSNYDGALQNLGDTSVPPEDSLMMATAAAGVCLLVEGQDEFGASVTNDCRLVVEALDVIDCVLRIDD